MKAVVYGLQGKTLPHQVDANGSTAVPAGQ